MDSLDHRSEGSALDTWIYACSLVPLALLQDTGPTAGWLELDFIKTLYRLVCPAGVESLHWGPDLGHSCRDFGLWIIPYTSLFTTCYHLLFYFIFYTISLDDALTIFHYNHPTSYHSIPKPCFTVRRAWTRRALLEKVVTLLKDRDRIILNSSIFW